MESQNKQILNHLKKGKGLTALEALKRFDCLRLSGRIFELRNQGHNIKKNLVQTKTGKRIAEYIMQ